MATPCCPKCGNTTFQMVEVLIQNANYRHNAIACANCGAVVAFEEMMSVMHMLGKIAERLGVQFSR